MDKKELKEEIKLLIQVALSKLADAGKNISRSDLIDIQIENLFETGFGRPDFLVRLGFLLVEVGLYPGRFQPETR